MIEAIAESGLLTEELAKQDVQQFPVIYRPGMAVVEATRNWGSFTLFYLRKMSVHPV